MYFLLVIFETHMLCGIANIQTRLNSECLITLHYADCEFKGEGDNDCS